MSLKESRKKIQRSIVFLTEEYPKELALTELLQVKKTLDAYISLLSEDAKEKSDG